MSSSDDDDDFLSSTMTSKISAEDQAALDALGTDSDDDAFLKENDIQMPQMPAGSRYSTRVRNPVIPVVKAAPVDETLQ